MSDMTNEIRAITMNNHQHIAKSPMYLDKPFPKYFSNIEAAYSFISSPSGKQNLSRSKLH